MQLKGMRVVSDEFSHYRIKLVLSKLLQGVSSIWIDVEENGENSTRSEIPMRTNESVRYFKENALKELAKLKHKHVKRKLDVIVFQYLLDEF